MIVYIGLLRNDFIHATGRLSFKLISRYESDKCIELEPWTEDDGRKDSMRNMIQSNITLR